MRTGNLGKLLAFVVIAAAPLMMSTKAPAQAPAPAPPPPQMPPSLVPSHSVDLMTAAGSAAFGAQWKTMEATIVERAPLLASAPYLMGRSTVVSLHAASSVASGECGGRCQILSPECGRKYEK